MISSRQKEGLLPPGKIYCDVQEFHPKADGEEDTVTAGFPCQVSCLKKSLHVMSCCHHVICFACHVMSCQLFCMSCHVMSCQLLREGASKAGLKLALQDHRTNLVREIWRIIDAGKLWPVLRVCAFTFILFRNLACLLLVLLLRSYALLENVGNILGKDMVELLEHILQD